MPFTIAFDLSLLTFLLHLFRALFYATILVHIALPTLTLIVGRPPMRELKNALEYPLLFYLGLLMYGWVMGRIQQQIDSYSRAKMAWERARSITMERHAEADAKEKAAQEKENAANAAVAALRDEKSADEDNKRLRNEVKELKATIAAIGAVAAKAAGTQN